MKVKFWGTRGSLPVSLSAMDVRAKLVQAVQLAQGRDLRASGAVAAFVDGLNFDDGGTFGGNTSCVQIDLEEFAVPNEHLILDMGSGLRVLGQSLMQRCAVAGPQTFHFFMSHLHWDHIMGLPFFTPAYLPGNRVVVHTCHAEAELALRRQQDPPSFPVAFDRLGAKIEFDFLQAGQTTQIAGMAVTTHHQRHAGDSYGWRFDCQGKRLVYTTDSEHRVELDDERHAFIQFFANADLVVFDAMYSLAEAISVKEDWGHSSNIVGVELCQAARVRKLVLFHHEPGYTDRQIQQVLLDTRRYEELMRDGHTLQVDAAWDSLVLVV